MDFTLALIAGIGWLALGVITLRLHLARAQLRSVQAQLLGLESSLARVGSTLERERRESERFIYVVAHDLKEIVRSVDYCIEVVEEDHASSLGIEGQRLLTRSRGLCARFFGMLSGLVRYSRLAQEELDPECFDLHALAEELLSETRGREDPESVQLEIAGQLPTVRCDPLRIAQVFECLIRNALQYNESEPRQIEIGCEEPDDRSERVRIYVRDNGIGIEPESYARAFEILKRLHDREAYQGGAGTGLAISRRILEMHGGRLWVESKPGDGSTFWIELPASAAAPAPGEQRGA